MRVRVLTLLLLSALSQDARGGWQTDGVPVCTASLPQINPVAVSDGAGGAIIAWIDGRSGATDVYAQRLNAGGVAQWTADGVVICNASSNQLALRIISDGAGGAIIVWTDYRGASPDIYAQRVNGSGAVQWTGNGVGVSTAAGTQQYPDLIANGSGGAVVVWEDGRNIAVTNTDIYGARVTSTGTVSDPGGIAICTNAALQYNATLSPFGTGGAIVSWSDQRTAATTSFDIYATRVTGLGVVVDVAGIAVCDAVQEQNYPASITDGSGGAIICWVDLRPAYGVYAQRLTSVGATPWTADGVPVNGVTSIPDFTRPSLLPDGSGGAFVAWASLMGSFNVYAQRVNSSGARQWLPDDLPVATDFGNQGEVRISSDEVGGALLAWSDPRDGQIDVYAQRLDAGGVVQWTAGGALVCGAAFAQTFPAVVSDGAGGGIVAWRDDRIDIDGNETDIYAQHVLGSGVVPTPVGGTPAARFAVRDAFPNPFSHTSDVVVTLRATSDVAVDVYDVAGRRVRALAYAAAPAGELRFVFDGRDDAGRALASGVYFYRVTVAGETQARKLVIVR